MKARVSALETGTEETVVIATVPIAWTEAERHEAVTAHAHRNGITSPFGIMCFGDKAATDVAIGYVGTIRDLMDYVAVHGRRLGDRRHTPSMEGSDQ
ncbi:hypothetical protein CJ301_10200 [Limimaricola cinnabarinus]|uniref:Uncharacterized protein n=1 Tax=Limimaricola cinnabarinus TaxID=1125964 RepID=A0A2G1MFR9_9RHOB|nr:hypothetical protein CJ301_10200 [Limimaricola cinnabarinus]